jgi:galactokinase
MQHRADGLMVSKVRDLFVKTFGAEPASLSRAPGRVEVLGNHTDYNEGLVLSCAIDRSVYAAAGPAPDGCTFELVSNNFPVPASISDPDVPVGQKWAGYPLGVYMTMKQGGYPVKPFRLAVYGDIPMESGLSSSAALEVAVALCLCSMNGIQMERVDMAKICQRAENEYVGANCGLLDQFSSLLGRKNSFLFIDFRTLSYRTISQSDAGLCIAITTSGVTHSMFAGAYNQRRRECDAAAGYFSGIDANVKTLRDVGMDMLTEHEAGLARDIAKRARHIIGENGRVLEGISLLEKGDMTTFGRLLYKSHESSRLNFENSCGELDTLVGIARSISGVYGARLTGGGFGGAMLTLLDSSIKGSFEKSIVGQYKEATGLDTQVHFAAVADGAETVTNW